MRPKKLILLIDTDEERRGELAFVLEINQYRVTNEVTADPDLMLIQGLPPNPDTCHALKAAHPHRPLVVVVEKQERAPHCSGADAVLWNPLGRAELLDRIKIMSARKRGPRRHTAQLLAATA